MITPGDAILLCNGKEVIFAGIDIDSGWPIVELPGAGLTAIDPILVQEGLRYD
jgi:hypothetical protein